MSERVVVRVAGADRADFLQGLITNSLPNEGGIAYAALLTPQGKFIADFLVLVRADEIWLDVDRTLAPLLLQRLTMYRLRADVQISQTDVNVGRGTGSAPEGTLPDPRHPALGWRAYGAEGGDDGTDWTALRVEHGIPEAGAELTPESYILELGFERLNGVDFRKGCFVGQEIVARMKHKTTLRKGLAQVRITGAAQPGPILDLQGREAGTLTTVRDGMGLAHLRFDRAEGPMTRGDADIEMTRNFLENP